MLILPPNISRFLFLDPDFQENQKEHLIRSDKQFILHLQLYFNYTMLKLITKHVDGIVICHVRNVCM